MALSNLKHNELMGLVLVFAGASWLGLGLYSTLLAANRILTETQLLGGEELLIFPLFYGIGAVLIVLGKIELRDAHPGKHRS